MSVSQYSVNLQKSPFVSGKHNTSLAYAETISADYPNHVSPSGVTPILPENELFGKTINSNPDRLLEMVSPMTASFNRQPQNSAISMQHSVSFSNTVQPPCLKTVCQADIGFTPTPKTAVKPLPLATTQSAQIPAQINDPTDDPEDLTISDSDLPRANSDTIKPKRKSKEINIGSIVANRYEILSEVSRGGYGVVYRARQLGVDRIVALKRLISQDNKAINKRFMLESNIIKNLIHPNTIQLIDAGVDDEHLFIVMEYIEGKSLRAMLRSGEKFTPQRAVHITKQILKSVNEAHQRGIIHRDLKPSNVLIRDVIGEEDFVKVLDFGIAKARNLQIQKLTQEGKIIGTPQYLAPELLFGEEATCAADIFSIGLILAEMLTGQTILSREIKKIIQEATSSAPIKLPDWLINSEVGPIVQKALQKDPKRRYRTAKDMLQDIIAVEQLLITQQNIANQPRRSSSITDQIKVASTKFPLITIAAMLFIISNVLLIYKLLS